MHLEEDGQRENNNARDSRGFFRMARSVVERLVFIRKTRKFTLIDSVLGSPALFSMEIKHAYYDVLRFFGVSLKTVIMLQVFYDLLLMLYRKCHDTHLQLP